MPARVKEDLCINMVGAGGIFEFLQLVFLVEETRVENCLHCVPMLRTVVRLIQISGGRGRVRRG